MPQTAGLFLMGAMAICGLPPFNGFISEFFLYNGLFHGLVSGNFKLILFILFSILGLVSIGGLALICFTKAFGTVFLGFPREKVHEESNFEKLRGIWPMYLIVLVIMMVGLFPLIFNPWLINIINLYQPGIDMQVKMQFGETLSQLTIVGWYSLAFASLILLVFFVKRLVTQRRIINQDETWGCAYTGQTGSVYYSSYS